MFIRVYDVTYVETQFNHLKLRNFISSWETVKATLQQWRRFFSHKINKVMQRKPGTKFFVNLLWIYFSPFFSVSIIGYEQVSASPSNN